MNYLEYLFILAVVLIIGFFGTKCYEYYLSKRRYRTIQDEFMSDLYHLQIKWAKKGCVDFSKSVSIVIDGFNLPPEEEEPMTFEGKEILRKLQSTQEEDNE